MSLAVLALAMEAMNVREDRTVSDKACAFRVSLYRRPSLRRAFSCWRRAASSSVCGFEVRMSLRIFSPFACCPASRALLASSSGLAAVTVAVEVEAMVSFACVSLLGSDSDAMKRVSGGEEQRSVRHLD